MSTLFEASGSGAEMNRPLADRLRPARLDEVVGQDHLLDAGAPLKRMLEAGWLASIIFWDRPVQGRQP